MKVWNASNYTASRPTRPYLIALPYKADTESFKKYCYFEETQRFVTLSSGADHWMLSWSGWIQLLLLHSFFVRLILILFSHMRQVILHVLLRAVPWLRRLVACLSPRRSGFDSGSVHVGFVVDKVALGQVFLQVLRFFPVNFIPPVLHYYDKTLIIFITGLHKKLQGCGASVVSAAGPFNK
jgi:hypothetical protein